MMSRTTLVTAGSLTAALKQHFFSTLRNGDRLALFGRGLTLQKHSTLGSVVPLIMCGNSNVWIWNFISAALSFHCMLGWAGLWNCCLRQMFPMDFLKKDTTIFSQRYLFSFLLSFATTFGEFEVKSLKRFLLDSSHTSRLRVSSSVSLKNYFDNLVTP